MYTRPILAGCIVLVGVGAVGCNGFGGGSSGARCGDGEREGTEVCDGSDLGGSRCEDEGFVQGTLACLSDCSGFDTSGCAPAECGDGIVTSSAGEECDDGEQNSDTDADACRMDCKASYCGDGVIDGGD